MACNTIIIYKSCSITDKVRVSSSFIYMCYNSICIIRCCSICPVAGCIIDSIVTNVISFVVHCTHIFYISFWDRFFWLIFRCISLCISIKCLFIHIDVCVCPCRRTIYATVRTILPDFSPIYRTIIRSPDSKPLLICKCFPI